MSQTDDGALLDLLFIQDATHSMKPYIESAKNSILEICTLLGASGRLQKDYGLQMGLVAYYDYPKGSNGDEEVLVTHPFTYNVEEMQRNLAALETRHGIDLPEAFNTAFDYAYAKQKGWRHNALKAIVVITDAAPHGIEYRGDNFPNGAPAGVNIRDPLEIAREMSEKGDFSIFILGCEPTLSSTTKYAIDFYRALATLTLGGFFSLINSNLLATFIIGSLLERIDLSNLSLKYQNKIARLFFEDQLTIEQVVDKLYDDLSSEGEKLTTIDSSEIYNDLEQTRANYGTFITSATLTEARGKLKKVHLSRIEAKCMTAIKNNNNNNNSPVDFSLVLITIMNRGSKHIAIKYFDAGLLSLGKEDVVPESWMIEKEFKINSPVNFILQIGRVPKYFCRVFDSNQDLDVDQIFNGS